MTNARLWTALAAACLLAQVPALAGEQDARQAAHDALAAQLPTVSTETRLPDVLEPGTDGHGEHKDSERKDGDHKDGERKDGEHKDGERRDGEHEGGDPASSEHGDHDRGEAGREDMGEHGEVGEAGGDRGSIEQENAGGSGHENAGSGPGEDHQEHSR